jgi:peptidoglycan hydrolase-like protein with peptidoglycan-binding domain
MSLSRKAVAWTASATFAVAGAAGVAIAVHAAHDQTPLRIVSISPSAGSSGVNGAGEITVTYNQPPPATAPPPVISPATGGSWQRTGDTMVFTPTSGFPAGTHVTVTARTAVDTADEQAGINPSKSASFQTGAYKTLRLQQALAQLGYLPMSWTPAKSAAPAANARDQLSAAYVPPAGTFKLQPGYPAQLTSFWKPGADNTLDKGAITAFEADHKLPDDGVAGPAVWKALLSAAAANQRNTHGYSYAIASQGSPESLTIWHNGAKVFSSPANTGISEAPTEHGTFPVYEKLAFQIMQGTNPDGSHYADPVPWVSYFNGSEAVHYFDRGSYGWPQSLGCVELPYDAAKTAYQYLPEGTLVTVE